MYAIINIMLGTNLSGNEKACLINNYCDASYGELRFTDNVGKKHIIVRGKHRFLNKGNFLTLDGKCVTQAELVSFYKDKKLFLSIINPLYFLTKKPAEQKELVDTYLSNISPKQIFDSLNETMQNFLLNKYLNKIEYQMLNEEQKTDLINTKMLNIFMDIAYYNLSKEEQEILEETPINIPQYISELNSDIKRAEGDIAILDGKIDYARTIIEEKLPKKKQFEKNEELTLAEQEFNFLSKNNEIIDKERQKQVVNSLERDILDKETEITELEKKMKSGKQTYLEIKKGTICECPTCGQHIQENSKLQTIENMKRSLTSDYDRKNLLETQIKDLKSNLMIEKCKYHALEGNTNIKNEKRIAIVTENIKRLENEKIEIEKFNQEILAKEKIIQNAQSDISRFNQTRQFKTEGIERLNKVKKVAQKLYITYIEEKMKLAKKYLKNVNIQFYSVLKTTGEIKDDFVITYNNTSLPDLSRSETIATAIEFANMFNKISQAHLPIFIDDYESCADYNFIEEYAKDTQIIISKVEKGYPLKIADVNSEKCTIIKPIIKGYRTSNTYNNAEEIRKAA